MKKQILTVTLATDVDLHNVHVDLVKDFCIASVTDLEQYSNVRFEQSMDYADRLNIVGERPETDAEAKKRIESKKKVSAKKKQDKQDEIERLEKALAKLKAKR